MKTTFTFLLLILSSLGFSQIREYRIVDSLRNKSTQDVKVFEIKKENFKTMTYEYKSIPNPEYLKIQQKIDSCETLINSAQQKCLSTTTKNHYDYAKKYLSDAVDKGVLGSLESSDRWANIKTAKKHLDAAGSALQQNTSGKYSLAIKQAKANIAKIDEILQQANSAGEEANIIISKIRPQLNQYNRQIGKGGYISAENNTISETIYDYIPTNEIVTREIMVMDTVDVAKTLSGTFIGINYKYDDGYCMLKEDFRKFKKRELIKTETLREYYNEYNISDISLYVASSDIENNTAYLIKSLENEKMYLALGDIFNSWCLQPTLIEFQEIMKEKGFEEITINGSNGVKYNGHQCVLTPDVFVKLMEKDVSIIEKMEASVNQFRKYNEAAGEIAVKLGNHIKRYKSFLLTYDRMEEWEKDTKACNAIMAKIRKLPYTQTEFFYSQLTNEDINLHEFVVLQTAYSNEKLGL
nr:hypothetical protein [uncultured Draconibacterium sp.]